MSPKLCLLALPLLLALGDTTWKDKRAAEWSADDAKEALTDSPWTHKTTPEIHRSQGSRGMGRRSGGGLSIPGLGGPRIGGGGGMGGGGWGGRGGGYPQGGSHPDDRGEDHPRGPRELTVRWESALPIQEAHLKSKDTDAPTMTEGQYAIVVLGLPARIADGLSKPKAKLERKGKKSISSSSAKVLSRDQGPVVVFFFPRSKEITKDEHEITFQTDLGRFQVKETFLLDEMRYLGKLEL